jgi:hypothetical protein
VPSSEIVSLVGADEKLNSTCEPSVADTDPVGSTTVDPTIVSVALVVLGVGVGLSVISETDRHSARAEL